MSLPAEEAHSAETPAKRSTPGADAETRPAVSRHGAHFVDELLREFQESPELSGQFQAFKEILGGSEEVQESKEGLKSDLEELINIIEEEHARPPDGRCCCPRRCQVSEEPVHAAESAGGELKMVDYATQDAILATRPAEVTVSVALDSGSVANVIKPASLPPGATPDGNKDGKHFVGASDEHIENFGGCDTLLRSDCGEMSCGWQVADVSRALHSVSLMAGPEEGPGLHDVVFTNKKCVVIPPGLLAKILETIKPIMEYKRRGGLYVADVSLSSFPRQGLTR